MSSSPPEKPAGSAKDDPAIEELAFDGVVGLSGRLARGEVTSRGLVELFLARIARFDPQLGAFTVVLADEARAEADAADLRRRELGTASPPLLGVPIAVKDNLDIAGVPTRLGTSSPELPAAFDAEIVRRLRSAGMVVLGKTSMPELALFPFGPARNAWDRSRTSGGSSSGSATAVAAGLAPAATASDGGGSIRVPAALSGLVGLKPTPGLVTLAPDADHWHGLTSAGFLTRSVEDAAELLDTVIGDGAIGGGAAGDELLGTGAPGRDTPGPAARRNLRHAASEPPTALRIGTSTAGAAGPRPVKPDSQVLAALSETADLLGDFGHFVRAVDVTIGPLQTTFIPRYLRGARDDAVRLVDRGALGPPARLATRLGGLVSERQVAAAQRRSAALQDRLLGIFGEIDVLLTPTMPTPPWPHDRFARSGSLRTLFASGDLVAYTSPWNVVGFPALSVPAGWTDDGLPLAAQLIGPPGSEATLLGVAAQLERRRGWGRRHPNLDIR